MSKVLRVLLVICLAVLAGAAPALSAGGNGWAATVGAKWYNCSVQGYYTIPGSHLGIVADSCQAEDGSGPAPWDGLEYHFVILNGRSSGVMDLLELAKDPVNQPGTYFYTTGATHPMAGRPIIVQQVMKGFILTESGLPY
jgi:hypothetical protein